MISCVIVAWIGDSSAAPHSEQNLLDAELAAEQAEHAIIRGRFYHTRPDNGIHSAIAGEPVDAVSVNNYLKSKLGDDVDGVEAAMQNAPSAAMAQGTRVEARTLSKHDRPDTSDGEYGR